VDHNWLLHARISKSTQNSRVCFAPKIVSKVP
jgi:hypothetical protein